MSSKKIYKIFYEPFTKKGIVLGSLYCITYWQSVTKLRIKGSMFVGTWD